MFRFMGLDVRRRPFSFPFNPFDAQKKLLEGLGISGPVIFDVGGHRGETIKQYRARFPNALVYSFEPSPDSLASLNRDFGDDPEIRIISLAVADQTGPRILHINEVDATNSLLPVAEGASGYLPGKGVTRASIQIQATSIDEFVAIHRLEEVHILKMDIQGSELMALKGAERTLRETHVPLIYAEIMFVPHYENQPLLNDIWEFLAGYGYSLFDVYYLHWANNGQLRFGNALFVSAEVRRHVIDARMEEH